MSTIKDIALKAGVSTATVSYVLNNTRFVSQERKDRVLHAIKELNYVPNAFARGLRVGVSKAIGLVISDVTNPFFPDLAKACDDMANVKGYTVAMLNTNAEQARMDGAVSLLREGRVDGLIIASASNQDRSLLEGVLKEGFPIVLAHRRIPNLEIDSVVADNFSGSYSAVRHLLALGHKKIAMIYGIDDSPVNIERIEGYRKMMSDAGLEVLPEWLISGQSKYEPSYLVATKMMKGPKKSRPTAMITQGDVSALGVIDALKDMGLEVPGDLALVSFDDLFLASFRNIQLTTVQIPRYEMAQQATNILLDRIDGMGPPGKIKIVLPTQLIVRKTCGATLS